MAQTTNGSPIAYGGHLLYRYSVDKAAGQTNGQGVAGKWQGHAGRGPWRSSARSWQPYALPEERSTLGQISPGHQPRMGSSTAPSSRLPRPVNRRVKP
ncbi:MAG: hypothetical protein ACYDAB_04620 [bacterium]